MASVLNLNESLRSFALKIEMQASTPLQIEPPLQGFRLISYIRFIGD